MALTATATPSIKQEIVQRLNQPIQAVASINQKNIFYACYELNLQPQGLYLSLFVYSEILCIF